MLMSVEKMTISNRWISTITVQKIRAITNYLYQLEVEGKCSDQQLGSWPVKANDQPFRAFKKLSALSQMDKVQGQGRGIAGLMH